MKMQDCENKKRYLKDVLEFRHDTSELNDFLKRQGIILKKEIDEKTNKLSIVITKKEYEEIRLFLKDILEKKEKYKLPKMRRISNYMNNFDIKKF